jgi:ABC-2 type transport system permease protein
MNLYILRITLRQTVGQRRTWVMLLFASVPVILALIFRLAADADENRREFFMDGMDNLVIGLILPLTALVFGTAVLGQELEDGTAVYLLSKPISRWRVVLEKAAAAWITTSVVLVISIGAMALILLAGDAEYRLILAASAALSFGALAYVSLFVCLSIMFSRALIIGVIYVFVWEALITALINNARYFSIREFTEGVGDALVDDSTATFNASLNGTESVILLLAVAAVTIVYASYRLGSFQLGDRT